MGGTGEKADASLKAPSCDGTVCRERPVDGKANASLDGEGSTRAPLAENAWITCSNRVEGSGSVPRAEGKAKKETEGGKYKKKCWVTMVANSGRWLTLNCMKKGEGLLAPLLCYRWPGVMVAGKNMISEKPGQHDINKPPDGNKTQWY